MNQNKPLAAIYVRVSTQDQAQHGFSLNAQQESLENYAKALGYEIFKIYRDEGKSAKDLKRPEMQQMLEDAKNNKFSAIFIYKLDRFSRSLKDLILTIDYLKNLGIDFVSLQDKIETASASGKLMFHIISAFAEFERNIIGDRTKFGMARKAKEGGFITKAPKGYKLVDKQLVPNEESEIIAKIFEEYLHTPTSLTQLAKRNGMTTSGIKKLLMNTTYLGKVKFANEESNGQHQPILNKHLFEQVQNKLGVNKQLSKQQINKQN
ncbi:recombinase family protein [Candidatus Pacearchaeota archaeon]|nr:recombinase family protein [Candidatus Pacearchaeota archaeon]